MEEAITYVGLDVHKATISVALAAGGSRAEGRYFGKIENSASALSKLAKKLSRSGHRLRFCYEAGPCGYGTYRHLRALGHDCFVVAPSLIPRRPGDRVKCDRRDSLGLAQLGRAGELTAVWVPDPEHEALRDLVRARAAAVRALRRSRQQLCGFLLRQGRVRSGKNWTRAHRRWLATLHFEQPAQQIVLEDYIQAVEDAQARRDRLTGEVEVWAKSWSLAPVAEALQALRGVALITAVTLLAEIGDLTRFGSPRQLMSHLGLVPSEWSSGATVRRGAITKAGNLQARSVLIEAAWCYRLPARVSPCLLKRLKGLPKVVRDIAWKAQVRLCARYRRMRAQGKDQRLITAAIARELLGFIWAIAQQVTPTRITAAKAT
jgi:transposase